MLDNWKLTNPDGAEVRPGDQVTTFRGEDTVFRLITKAPDGGSEGKIVTDLGEHYPSVYGLKITARS